MSIPETKKVLTISQNLFFLPWCLPFVGINRIRFYEYVLRYKTLTTSTPQEYNKQGFKHYAIPNKKCKTTARI